jgi:hypothetical protein
LRFASDRLKITISLDAFETLFNFSRVGKKSTLLKIDTEMEAGETGNRHLLVSAEP